MSDLVDQFTQRYEELRAAGGCPCWASPAHFHGGHCCFDREERCHDDKGLPVIEALDAATNAQVDASIARNEPPF